MATQEQLRKGFILGEWRIWPNAGQIEKDGNKVHIEPKLVEVLLLLAQSSGHVVSREELLDHAWQRQVVCDEALTRTISELRTLLGDSDRERRYIRTIPKRGYSLVAEVEAIAAHGTDCETRDASRSLSVTTPMAPLHSFLQRLIRFWLYGVGSLATATAGLFVLVFAFSDEVSVDVYSDDKQVDHNVHALDLDAVLKPLVKDSLLSQGNRYAVLPFTNLTPEQDLGFFTQGLAEDIRTTLFTLPNARVLGRLSSEQFRDRSQARNFVDIASHLNVDAIVDGTVRLIDGQIRVTVQLIDGVSGFPIWSKRYDKVFTDVLSLQTDIADDIFCELDNRLPTAQLVAMVDKKKISRERDISLSGGEYGHTRHVEWLAR